MCFGKTLWSIWNQFMPYSKCGKCTNIPTHLLHVYAVQVKTLNRWMEWKWCMCWCRCRIQSRCHWLLQLRYIFQIIMLYVEFITAAFTQFNNFAGVQFISFAFDSLNKKMMRAHKYTHFIHTYIHPSIQFKCICIRVKNSCFTAQCTLHEQRTHINTNT